MMMARRPRPRRSGMEKQWRFTSANGTCWRSLQVLLGEVATDALMLQEHHLGTPAALASAERWGMGAGWRTALSSATPSEGGGTHGGTGVAVRSHIGLACWPGRRSPTLHPGRASGAWLAGYAAGGIALASVYLQVGTNFGAINSEVLQSLADALQAVEGPWIIGGDWNIDAREMRASMWLECVGGVVVAPTTPTCTAGNGGRVIDYFVVDRRLLPFVRAVEALHGAVIATHLPVTLTLSGGARELQVRQLVRPRAFPVDLPMGCRWPPPASREHDPIDLTLNCRMVDWIKDCEAELCVAFDLKGDPGAEKFCGRSKEPRFADVCAMGKPGSRHPLTTQVGRAARCLRSLLEDLLAARSWGRRELECQLNWRMQRARGAWGRDGLPRHICVLLRHPNWLRNSELVQLLVDVRAIHVVEESRHRQQSLRCWREWAVTAVKNGACEGHKFCRLQPSDALEVVAAGQLPLGPQAAVEELAEEWAERWQEGLASTALRWPTVLCLPCLTGEQIRDAAATFPRGTGMGLDSFHPRSLLLLSDRLLGRLAELLTFAEGSGVLPQGMAGLLVHFIGKEGGGCVPLFSSRCSTVSGLGRGGTW